MRSGFATLVGRPNVGKSTLLNAILGQKVSITSPIAQTTRNQVRGVLSKADAQIVFVDTPGIHKPRTLLGSRLNETAADALGVDVTLFVIDATAPVGKGDRFVADLVTSDAMCVVNKIDAADRAAVLTQLSRAGDLGLSEYFPVSAKTGEGVADLVDAIVGRLPEGPALYPDDMVTDVPEAFWVAELVREQLLHVTREEVPHSIACRVTEWEWPRIRVEILVERDSQKGIVIGKKGAILKEVGTRVREQLPAGAFIELFVKVDREWQSRPKALERLGY
ncbi:GTPase Era [Acidiferrimicrobium sp. IK]|uniref:GTPase Era n=1 Tax=Acidiferrimicrobium sp. IK TaxID=2871700 RepID=UPI0021CAFDB9|nr:GTPase Era [Acidiferrimicrobium sp. IK]MCU4183926.1 GTPase Era [Acidiferrimicrobium sp. IK]